MKRYDEELSKKKKRDDDDLDEVEEDVVIQPTKKEKPVKKPSKDRDVKVVEDFNLLDVPKKINLKPLFEDFVIPMIPDGYEIKFKPKKTSSPFIDTTQRKSCYVDRIYSIDEIVYQTRQPRALFPTCKTKRILKVVRQRSGYELLLSSTAGGNDPSSEEENDESMYSMESDQNLSAHQLNVYMFSKFMRDLEDLIDLSMPSIEKKIAEMSSNLSASAETHDKKSTAIDRKDSGISLNKSNVKHHVVEETSEDSDIESEAEDDDDEENREIAKNTLIDKIVKDANMKRCRGRWSSRDIHDVKFNEDRLTIQFRTGRLGLFALAANRYCNFPFQSWDIKPDLKM
jgi:cancer susceptibility candidate protein 1